MSCAASKRAGRPQPTNRTANRSTAGGDPARDRPRPGGDGESVEQAWRLLGLLNDSIAKVDAKASFAFAVESALGAFAATMLASPLESWTKYLLLAGLAALGLGVLSAVGVVLPRLGGPRSGGSCDQYLYFGHLRSWSPERLVDRLRNDDPVDPVARQCVVLAGIAWRKHRLLQHSLRAAAVGGVLVVTARVIGA